MTNFLYPLPFYLAEPFYFLTKNPVIAAKIIMGLAIASMTAGSYFLFKKWGIMVGIIGALIAKHLITVFRCLAIMPFSWGRLHGLFLALRIRIMLVSCNGYFSLVLIYMG